MKRNCRYFESQSNNQKDHTHEQERFGSNATIFDHICNHSQFGGAGGAIDQGHSVQEESGCERSQQEIFQSRFVGLRIIAPDSRENIQGYRYDFDSQENHDHVGGGGEQNHSHGTEQDEAIIFPNLYAFAELTQNIKVKKTEKWSTI